MSRCERVVLKQGGLEDAIEYVVSELDEPRRTKIAHSLFSSSAPMVSTSMGCPESMWRLENKPFARAANGFAGHALTCVLLIRLSVVCTLSAPCPRTTTITYQIESEIIEL